MIGVMVILPMATEPRWCVAFVKRRPGFWVIVKAINFTQEFLQSLGVWNTVCFFAVFFALLDVEVQRLVSSTMQYIGVYLFLLSSSAEFFADTKQVRVDHLENIS